MKKLQFIITIIGLTLITFSCKSKQNTTTEETVVAIEDNIPEPKEKSTNYLVIELNGKKELKKNPTLKFNFEKNSVSGNNGCNSYGGKVITKKNSISFSMMRSTEMYCEETAHIEKEFMSSLRKADHYYIEGNRFFLYNVDDRLLLIGVEENYESKKQHGIPVKE